MMDPATWLAMVTSGWSDVSHTAFWVALLKIMWINILLSGDNAVVIAMACRGLPHRQRVWGMILGAGVAVLLRIVFTVFVAALMLLPWLKIVGGLALFYIAAKLLVPDDPDEDERSRQMLYEKYAPGYSGDLADWRARSLPIAVDLSG